MLSQEDIVGMFNAGLDCSMVVMGEVADKIGMKKEDAYKVASLFGAGMMNDTVCGAVTGAYMAIGCRYGNSAPGDMSQKGIVMAKREEFNAKFKEAYRSVMCPVLTGYRLSIPEEYQKAGEAQVLARKCPLFCIKSIEILNEIL